MRVVQILCAAGPVDAVTTQALAYRKLFRSWGWSGDDYAPVTAPGMPGGAIRPLHQLRPGRADVVVLHYSGHAPGLEDILARAPRSLLVSHNITPARYFWSSDPAEAVRCQLARGQLARLGVVIIDGLELIPQIFLDDRFHVLGQVGQLLVDLILAGPDAPADQRIVVVGQMHEPREILAQTDWIDNGEPHAAGGKAGEQSRHHHLQGTDGFGPAGLIGMDQQ